MQVMSANSRVLVVEDHQDIADNIGDFLTAKGHSVEFAGDGLCGLHLAATHPFDAVILDLMLPRLGGLEMCRKLRDAGVDVPVIMLTARDRVPDKIEGFRAGTDDYMTKPFSLQELEARLQALVRRSRGASSSLLQVGDLTLDQGTLEVTRAGKRLQLNRGCLKALTELMQCSPNVVAKSRLEVVLWGDQPSGPDALRSQMCALRRMIDRDFDVPLLHTVHGVGYRLIAPDSNED